jgi:hypothetical protein
VNSAPKGLVIASIAKQSRAEGLKTGLLCRHEATPKALFVLKMRTKLRFASRLLALTFLLTSAALYQSSSPAHAACADPVGTAGQILYNTEYSVMQYCNDTDWIKMGPTPASGDTTSDLVLYLKLDETSGTIVNDSSGNNYDGTLTGYADPNASWVTDAIAGGAHLSGYNALYDEVAIDSSAPLLDAIDDTMTIALWIKSTGDPVAWPSIVAKLNPGTAGWGIYRNNTTNHLYLRVDTSAGANQTSTTELSNVLDGTWHHVAYTLDNGVMKGYLDGALINDSTYSHGTGFATSGATDLDFGIIGAYYDEIRVYSRALSGTDIQTLYDSAGSGDYNTSLALHWKLDETSGTTANDASGNGRTGTMTNGLSGTDTVSGKDGTAINFGGGDDYINGASITSPSAGSMAIWFKTDVVADGNQHRIWGNHTSFEFYIAALGFLGADVCGADTLSSTIQPSVGEWYHAVYTWDVAQSKSKLYINGVLISDKTMSLTCGQTGNLYAGWRVGAAVTEYFDGALDDLRYYTRVLSADDVQALYAATGGIDYTTGLVGHWALNETSGTSIADSSSSANTGTVGGGLSTAADSIAGQISTGLNFQYSSTDYINLGSPAALDNLGPLTISAWIKPTNNATCPWQQGIIYSTDGASSPDGYSFLITQGGALQFGVDTGGGLYRTTNYGIVNTGTWQHVVATWDGTSSQTGIKIYINGTEVSYSGGQDQAVSFDDSATNKYIGAYNATCSMDGGMDDVRIFNRALTSSDIGALYTVTTPDTTTGLIGHWKLDETSGSTAVNTASPGTHDGTFGGGMTPATSTQNGVNGTAFEFDGAVGNDDYINVADANALDLTSFSISGWIYSYDTTQTSYIMEKSAISPTDVDNYWLVYADDFVSCGFHNGTSWQEVFSGHPTPDDRWMHVACSYDNTSKRMDVYLDGVSIGHGTLTGSPVANTHPLYIGRSRHNTDYTVVGILDDTRLYNRALSASDMLALYQEFVPDNISGMHDGYFVAGFSAEGDIGGLSAANAACYTALASGSWLGKSTAQANGQLTASNVEAWLCDDTTCQDLTPNANYALATTSFPSAGGNVMRTTMHGYIEDDDVGLDFSNRFNEFFEMWTGRGTDNLPSAAGTCNNWTSNLLADDSIVGVTDTGLYSEKLAKYPNTCDEMSRVICMVHPNADTSSACTSPAGPEGTIIYDKDRYEMMFCNGSKWVSMEPQGITSGAPSSNLTLSDGLVAHWKFDEGTGTTAADSTSNGIDGTLTNGPTWVAGVDGGAIELDGVDDYINLGTTSLLNISTDITISLWLKPDTAGELYSPDRYADIYARESAGGDGIVFETANGGGISNAILVWSNNMWVMPSDNDTLTFGNWQHIVVTVDNGTVTFYSNGIAVGGGTGWDLDPAGASVAATIGANNNGPAEHVDGTIDEMRIYDRVLSVGEVSELYIAGVGGSVLDPNKCAGATTPGTACTDGSIYAGDGANGYPIYITRCDLGQTWNGSACTGTRTQLPWNDGNGSGGVFTDATDFINGAANTAALITIDSDSGTGGVQPHQAAQACADLSMNGFDDWYLPAYDDVGNFCTAKATLGNFRTTNGDSWFWSSTETHSAPEPYNAARVAFFDCYGYGDGDGKPQDAYIRCARQNTTTDPGPPFVADCTSPDGIAGEMIYNTDYDVMQYCNGQQWVGIEHHGSIIPCSGATVSFTSVGATTTTVPAGCTTATIEAWGGGGGGGFGNATAGNRRSGGGGGGSGVAYSGTVLLAAGGGGGGGGGTLTAAGSNNGGGGGGYAIGTGEVVLPGATLNVYVGGGGTSSCSAGVNGPGGNPGGTAGANGSNSGSVTTPFFGGSGGNSGNGNSGTSTYGGTGGDTQTGSPGATTYGGTGGDQAVGGGGGGYSGTVTTGSNGTGAAGGAGATGGGYSAGSGATGGSCANVGGNGRVRITFSD